MPLYSHSLDAVELPVPILSSYSSQLLLYSRCTDYTENTAFIVETPLLEFPRGRYTASSLARWLLPINGPVFLAAYLLK
jgi:hypothetical protein